MSVKLQSLKHCLEQTFLKHTGTEKKLGHYWTRKLHGSNRMHKVFVNFCSVSPLQKRKKAFSLNPSLALKKKVEKN